MPWRMWSVVTTVETELKITVLYSKGSMWKHFLVQQRAKTLYAFYSGLEFRLIFEREMLVYEVGMGQGHQEVCFPLTSDPQG